MPVEIPPSGNFDYIVCGGGTSGCVVASRLSEDPDVTVLLVEAGADSKGMENVDLIGAYGKLLDGVPTDWNIVGEPNPGLDGRCVKASRGKFLGGCSGCNETFHTKDWFDANVPSHGYEGPVHTEPMDLAPISELVLESMQSKGLKLCPDLFTTGESPNACGHAVRTRHKGLRSSATGYLREERPNLTILTNTLVDKVILEAEHGSSDLVAKAVQVLDSSGTTVEIRVNREIIVSGGTYCSPAILMRSGIGAKTELEPLGIKCQVDLPGVGKNLMDHPIVFTFYEATTPNLTLDTHFSSPTSFAETYRQWKDERSGALSHIPFGAMAFARLDSRLSNSTIWTHAPRPSPHLDPMSLNLLSQPSIEFFSLECYGGPKQYTDFPLPHQHCFGIVTELFGARSRGTVKLKSRNPLENPVVDHNYLNDAHGLDLEVLSEAVAFANEIITESEPTRNVLKGAWPSGTRQGWKHRDDWKDYVKRNATTCYHPSGTLKMGASSSSSSSSQSDPLSVLDNRLRVKGVKALRVADCSVMPNLPQAHTQMPAYGIGEKAADLIKQDRAGGRMN
ncbi:putative gmc oxidoreductase [Phaeomoniella chlamydospora]|uniref:Putative gmc oxidoreductase n=1 Tax=Phaeomoniella chlamydospora TaxID=158046 RepID=A0A0G2FZM8_PHACM|nr:putative gmc oxidoreductase [Phaeomoniella chlamydospora]